MIMSDTLPSKSSPTTSAAKVPKKLRYYPHTDAGNGEMIADRYSGTLCFDHAFEKWLIFQGHRWQLDATKQVHQFATKLFRERLKDLQEAAESPLEKSAYSPDEWKNQVRWALRCEDQSKREAALKSAASQPGLADAGLNWNADPMLLGVKNGVVNLNTGHLRSGVPADRITLTTNVQFCQSATCPRFRQFLVEVFKGDLEVIEFVQRAIGYTLTGRTDEQVLFILTGEGANGKSTFIDALFYAIGEYAHNLPFSAFELTGRSAISNDIAGLRGKRFVTALETNESSKLNEARIKMLTGQDEVTARKLYQDFAAFKPCGKIWLVFNRKPLVQDDSEGFWRRILIIDFGHYFSESQRDPKLIEKLHAEAPGILNWAIEGCLKWQRGGLNPPNKVRIASQSYREESDQIGQFIQNCFECHASAFTSIADVTQAYNDWISRTGNPKLSPHQFNQKLTAKGFVQHRVGKSRDRVWRGLRIKPTPQTPRLDQVTNETNDSPLLVM